MCRLVGNPKVTADVPKRLQQCYGDKRHREVRLSPPPPALPPPSALSPSLNKIWEPSSHITFRCVRLFTERSYQRRVMIRCSHEPCT